MAQFIYYRDEDEEKGPFDEAAILKMYNGALFTSDVAFQIRSSETDTATPFVPLRVLISKNGPVNPFCNEFADIDKRIEEAEKELAELRKIASKKAELEKKMAEIEKQVEEKTGNVSSGPAPIKPAQKKVEARKNTTTNANSKPKIPKEMDSDEERGYIMRKMLIEQHCSDMVVCPKCKCMLANFKQRLMHSYLSFCDDDCIPEDISEQFEPDFVRWDEEDAARLEMGRSLFSRLTEDEKGSARPQTDFIEDINMKLEKEMMLGTERGRERAMEFLQSDAAKKIKDRLEKHFREAKGKLVCKKCKVSCKNHIHFLIHLSSYGHQTEVKGTSFELVSLLIGWFSRDLYLQKADESEMDESIDPDESMYRMMDAMRLETPLVYSSFK